jgi:SAM-dependent methyltransferase
VTLSDAVHRSLVHPRRVRVLAEHAAALVPHGAHVLDVGTGDGRVVHDLVRRRPDLHVEGLDVMVRGDSAISVGLFDGRTIPRPAASVDVVTFFDVLHHADDPPALLAEAARVARICVVVKDHVCDGAAARAVLTFMDRVGNLRHGVALPHNYLSSEEWARALGRLRLERSVWDVGGLGLYPWPASLVFGGRLHVLARLSVPPSH